MYLGRDSSGKVVQKIVRGSSKKDVERLSASLRADYAKLPGEKMLGQAVHTYVESRKDSALYSPETYKGYASNERSLQKYAEEFMRRDMWSLTSADIENLFRSLSASGLSAKTLKNMRGLLSGAFRMAGGTMPDLTDATKRILRNTQQKTVSVDEAEDDDLYAGRYFPTSADIIGCMKYAEAHRPDLVIPIALAAYCGLRRSEICGLTLRDFDRNSGTVSVSRAMVKTAEGNYVYKDTKTDGSRRVVPVPSALMDKVLSDGVIYDKSPKSLSDAWEHVVAGAVREGLAGGLFTFHGLRHFAAGWWMTELHFDVKLCMDLGGWSSQKTLLSIYAYVLSEAREHAADNINRAGNAFLREAGL